MSILATKQIECSTRTRQFYSDRKLNGVIFDLALWKRAKKNSTIRFCFNSGVKDNDDACIGFTPNEPSKSLFEFYDCLRQLVIIEWVASLFFERFKSSLQERLVRNAKRQFGDDYILQRVTLDIDSLPETIGSEQDTARFRFKLLK